MNFLYYLRKFSYNLLPTTYFAWNYKRLKKIEKQLDNKEIEQRLDYYFKIKEPFRLPSESVAVKDFKRKGGTGYYLDLKEFLHYFKPKTKFAYVFGDHTHVNTYPTLFKARPIYGENANSILFKLNKQRHFRWVNDPYTFKEKKDLVVWRGGAYQKLRRVIVEKIWNHPLCDVGQTNSPKEEVPWQKPLMKIAEQLKYKFILCPEGNDVATNLKWAMSSNSLCIMPKPKYETWFMEGTLEAGVHYVEVKDDCSDLEEKVDYYLAHQKEAEKIINQAHQYVNQFKNKDKEDLLCLKVLERYALMSGQKNLIKFKNS